MPEMEQKEYKELTEEEKAKADKALDAITELAYNSICFTLLVKKNLTAREFEEFINYPEHEKYRRIYRIYQESKRYATKEFRSAFRVIHPFKRIKRLEL